MILLNNLSNSLYVFFRLELRNCEIQINNKIITFDTYQSQVFNQLDKEFKQYKNIISYKFLYEMIFIEFFFDYSSARCGNL